MRLALRDALASLGWRGDQLLEGIAVALELTTAQLTAPDTAAIATVDPARLAVILDAVRHHDDPALRQIASVWMRAHDAAYQLPADVVQGWLIADDPLVAPLRPRLEREGLALLGPERLRALAAAAGHAVTRQAAQRWVARFA